jgi:hypothetical protein
MTRPSPRYKVMATFQDPFPYNVPRLSDEHATIHFGFESAGMSFGATSRVHQNWTSDNENLADDVMILVTAPADIRTIGDLLLTYERATDARSNIRKSKALAAGSWDTFWTFHVIRKQTYLVSYLRAR